MKDVVYTLNIRKTKNDIDLNDVGADYEKNREMIRVLTMEVKDKMRQLKYQQITRASIFYDRESSRTFEESHNIYQGFHVPCKLIESGVALQIALRTKLVCKDTALSKLIEIYQNHGHYWQEHATYEFVGRSVRANYGNNRFWRVDSIAFDKNPTSTFDWQGKGPTPFATYYASQYNVKIKEMNQPLLVNVDKRDPNKITYVVPELVSLTGFSDDEFKTKRRKLNKALELRVEDQLSLTSKLAERISQCKSLLGTSVGTNPICAEAILIKAPQIHIGGGRPVILNEPDRDFFVRNEILEPKKFAAHTWLFVYEEEDKFAATKIITNLGKVATGHGIELGEPHFLTFKNAAWKSDLQGILTKDVEEAKADFTLTVIPSRMSEKEAEDCYNFIKRISYKERPTLNQVVRARIVNEEKGLGAKMSKLLVQMNAKKGGSLWNVQMFKMDIPIIMGVDICHKKEKDGQKSYIGFCATMDAAFTSIYSLAYPIPPGQELMHGLKHCIKSALANFLKKYANRFIPNLLIMYRDGIGENAFKEVVESEVKQITDYISNIKEELGLSPEVWNPKVIYIVVNKQVNTRFFEQTVQGPVEGRGTLRPIGGVKAYSSAKSGTLVAQGVTDRKYDFYIIAQKLTQGVARPTHYHVVYDSSILEPEKLYLLTYRLCFLDFNYTGGIRVPAPCQYAHKLANMAANSIGGAPSKELASNPYFL